MRHGVLEREREGFGGLSFWGVGLAVRWKGSRVREA